MKVNNYANDKINIKVRLFGTDEKGDQKNYPFDNVLGVTNSIEVVDNNNLTEFSIAEANTYFTGTAGASFEITLPEANPDYNTYKYIIMSTVNRPSVTWVAVGASIVGLPTSLSANTPICVQYNNVDTTYYISM